MAKSRIHSIKLVQPVQFFGVSGSQLSPSQGGGLDLTETSKGVAVTSKAFPGKVAVVFNANIAHIIYEEVGE